MCLVAVGGGSTSDTCKGIAMMLAEGGDLHDYEVSLRTSGQDHRAGPAPPKDADSRRGDHHGGRRAQRRGWRFSPTKSQGPQDF